MKPSLDCRGTNALPMRKAFTANAVDVLPEDLATKWFCAAVSWADARETLIEITPATQAMELESLQVQVPMAHPKRLMTKLADKTILLA
jgi:hypothetical protein